MRVIDLDSGQSVQAANDDDLATAIRELDDAPEKDLGDEELRELISSRAYEATDS